MLDRVRTMGTGAAPSLAALPRALKTTTTWPSRVRCTSPSRNLPPYRDPSTAQEASVCPGAERKHNGLYGDGYQNLGQLATVAEDTTAPLALAVHGIADNWKHTARLCRYTLRVDGFVALQVRLKPGKLIGNQELPTQTQKGVANARPVL